MPGAGACRKKDVEPLEAGAVLLPGCHPLFQWPPNLVRSEFLILLMMLFSWSWVILPLVNAWSRLALILSACCWGSEAENTGLHGGKC